MISRDKKRSGWLGNFVLAMGSLVFCFVAFELLARLFVALPSPYALDDPRLVLDQRGFWINQPNQEQHFSNGVDFVDARMRTDRSGLRHVPCRRQDLGDAPRLYIVGDSQTFGWGVGDEESWVNRLQCLLNEADAPAGVVNLGVPGTNLDQYLSRTRMFHDGLRPQDMVIYVVTWNDFHTWPGKAHSFDPVPPCVGGPEPTFEDYYPAYCPMPTPRYYGERTNWRRRLYDAMGIFIPSFADAEAFAHSVVYSSVAAHMLVPTIKGYFIRHRGSDTLQRVHPDAFSANTRLMQAVADAAGRKTENVVFALLPNRISYADSLYDLYSKDGTVFPEQDFLAHYTRDFCAQPGIRCLSLFAALNTAKTGVHEFKHDGHLNAAGSRKVARAVFGHVLPLVSGPLNAGR